MLRLRFMDGADDLHVIEASGIERYKISGQKLVSDDFFMNEPAGLEIELVLDRWLSENLETQTVKIGKGVWFKYPVKAEVLSRETGNYELRLTGLIDLTQCEIKPFQKRMRIVIYDYSALLSQLDLPVRIHYPYSPQTGTDFKRFIVNYALPGESETEQPEDHPEGTQWFAYEHSLQTDSRRVGEVIQVLAEIWRQYYEGLWELSFAHSYSQEAYGAEVVQNMIVEVAQAEDFYTSFVLGLVSSAWNHRIAGGGSEYLWLNYGVLAADGVADIYAEFGIALMNIEAECYLIMRAGYDKYPGPAQHEWYRIFAFLQGRQVYDSGQKRRSFSVTTVSENMVGTQFLLPENEVQIPETEDGHPRLYRTSDHDLGYWDWTDNPLDYLAGLSFYMYYSGKPGAVPHWVSQEEVSLAEGESFYGIFIDQMVLPMYSAMKALATNNRYFWANYGLLPAAERQRLVNEYGAVAPANCEAYFVLRCGYTYGPMSKDQHHNPGVDIGPEGWTDGEGGGGGGSGSGSVSQWQERYRIFAIKAGEVVRDYGMQFAGGLGQKNGQNLGGLAFAPGRIINVGENSFYQDSENSLAVLGETPADYLAGLDYYLRFTGYKLSRPGWLANRIFRMKTIPQNPGHEQYLSQNLRDWLKLMFFLGNISCFADSTGLIHFAPRLALGEAEIPWENLVDANKQLLIYQPWDAGRLEEYIADRAEIDYLIQYYGGKREISHCVELRFLSAGWQREPELREKLLLNDVFHPDLALFGSGWYMIVEKELCSRYELLIKAIKV